MKNFDYRDPKFNLYHTTKISCRFIWNLPHTRLTSSLVIYACVTSPTITLYNTCPTSLPTHVYHRLLIMHRLCEGYSYLILITSVHFNSILFLHYSNFALSCTNSSFSIRISFNCSKILFFSSFKSFFSFSKILFFK